MRFGAYYQFEDEGFIGTVGRSTENFEEWIELMECSGVSKELLKLLYETVKPYEHIIYELAYLDGFFVIYFNETDGTIKDMVRLFEEFELNPDPYFPFRAEFSYEPHSGGFFMEVYEKGRFRLNAVAVLKEASKRGVSGVVVGTKVAAHLITPSGNIIFVHYRDDVNTYEISIYNPEGRRLDRTWGHFLDIDTAVKTVVELYKRWEHSKEEVRA